MESETQYVVRHVVADYLEGWNSELCDRLRKGDTEALELLRELIAKAEKGWGDEFRVYAMKHEGMYWRLMPQRIETEDDGTLVKLEWGWNAGNPEDGPCPFITTSGGDAFDLAMEILEMFTDDNGDPVRPERPEYEEPERSPKVTKFFEDFSKLGGELMEKEGFKGGCSLADITAWVRSGKPDEPIKHEWVDYPEDHVRVCATCGSYYYTDRDDWGSAVCAGEPVTDDDRWSNIHNFDPRRSEALREAQRLDRLIMIMKKHGEATTQELKPLVSKHAEVLPKLTKEERERYNKERVGQ